MPVEEHQRHSERPGVHELMPLHLNHTLNLIRFLPSGLSNVAQIQSPESDKSIKIMMKSKIKNEWHNE